MHSMNITCKKHRKFTPSLLGGGGLWKKYSFADLFQAQAPQRIAPKKKIDGGSAGSLRRAQ